MKNDRLFSILLTLLDQGFATAESLAAKFEVSQRTIYRDMDALGACGIPVESDAGPGGGYSIRRSYRFDRSFFSKRELSALANFLEGVGDLVRDTTLADILLKIRAMGEASGAEERPSLRFATPPWMGRMPGEELVDRLRFACEERWVIAFSYLDAQGRRSERSVEPYEVLITQSAFYLHAFCRSRSEFRVFKLSRIGELSIRPERFDPGCRAAQNPWDSLWGGETSEAVSLEISQKDLPRAMDLFPDARQAPAKDGRTSLAFNYPVGDYLAALLVSLPGAHIVGPERLRRLCVANCESFIAANNH